MLEAICKLFNCSPIALTEILNHPAASIRIHDFLQNKQIRTNYINRESAKKKCYTLVFRLKMLQPNMLMRGI